MEKCGIQDQKLKANPFPNVIIGDCGNEIAKLELDRKYDLAQVKRIAHMLLNRYKLGGFKIYESSCKTQKIWNKETDLKEKVIFKFKIRNYHLIFNRKMRSVSELHSILAWICLQTKDWDLIMWFLLQCVKQTVTLRTGFKGKTRPPKEVCRFGKQDKMIKEFEDNRQFILNFMKRRVKNRNGVICNEGF